VGLSFTGCAQKSDVLALIKKANNSASWHIAQEPDLSGCNNFHSERLTLNPVENTPRRVTQQVFVPEMFHAALD